MHVQAFFSHNTSRYLLKEQAYLFNLYRVFPFIEVQIIKSLLYQFRFFKWFSHGKILVQFWPILLDKFSVKKMVRNTRKWHFHGRSRITEIKRRVSCIVTWKCFIFETNYKYNPLSLVQNFFSYFFRGQQQVYYSEIWTDEKFKGIERILTSFDPLHVSNLCFSFMFIYGWIGFELIL